MKYLVERTFYDIKNTHLEWSYQYFKKVLEDLIYEMTNKIGHPFIEGDDLKIIMNPPIYHKFCIACEMSCHDPSKYRYRNIRIIPDSSIYRKDTDLYPNGNIKMVYEGSDIKFNPYYRYWTDQSKIKNAINGVYGLASAKPHIDHVKFNGPATIVFWKDGTKTIVKHDGKGRKDKRQASLYAFIRKIYGEGKPYHNILNEIEEAIK